MTALSRFSCFIKLKNTNVDIGANVDLQYHLLYMQGLFWVRAQPKWDYIVRYIITSSLIGWAHAQKDLCICNNFVRNS